MNDKFMRIYVLFISLAFSAAAFGALFMLFQMEVAAKYSFVIALLLVMFVLASLFYYALIKEIM